MSISLDYEQSGAYLFLRVTFGHASYFVIINFNRGSRGSSVQFSSEVFLNRILLWAVSSAKLLEQSKFFFPYPIARRPQCLHSLLLGRVLIVWMFVGLRYSSNGA